MKIYSKIHNYNLTYSIQETLYIVYQTIQLSEVYLKYIEAQTKAKLFYFYIIPKIYKNP